MQGTHEPAGTNARDCYCQGLYLSLVRLQSAVPGALSTLRRPSAGDTFTGEYVSRSDPAQAYPCYGSRSCRSTSRRSEIILERIELAGTVRRMSFTQNAARRIARIVSQGRHAPAAARASAGYAAPGRRRQPLPLDTPSEGVHLALDAAVVQLLPTTDQAQAGTLQPGHAPRCSQDAPGASRFHDRSWQRGNGHDETWRAGAKRRVPRRTVGDGTMFAPRQVRTAQRSTTCSPRKPFKIKHLAVYSVFPKDFGPTLRRGSAKLLRNSRFCYLGLSRPSNSLSRP